MTTGVYSFRDGNGRVYCVRIYWVAPNAKGAGGSPTLKINITTSVCIPGNAVLLRFWSKRNQLDMLAGGDVNMKKNKGLLGCAPEQPQDTPFMQYNIHRRVGARIQICRARSDTGSIMEYDITPAISKLDLKVLTKYDEIYKTHVAYCIDTGAVATGETEQEAQALIKETLELDILLAVRGKSLEGLFRVCAAPFIRAQWYEMRAVFPNEMETMTLDITLDPPKRGATSEVKIFKSRDRCAA
jgi:hypothetical protein